MFSATAKTNSNALNYSTVFEGRVLGVKCDVEVVVGLAGGATTVVASMKQALWSGPAFHLSAETLEELAACIRAVREQSKLLDSLTDGAKDHQLNWSSGGATLIVVKPAGRPARFVMTIGLFHREGPLEELSTKDVDEAVATLDGLRRRVLAKVRPAAQPRG